MTDYESLYERLTSYERIGDRSIEEWLKSVKNGEDPNVTNKERRTLREIHEETVSRNIDRAEGVGERFVTENTFQKDGRTVLQLKTDSGTREIPIEEVGSVEYVQGEPRVRNAETGYYEDGYLEI